MVLATSFCEAKGANPATYVSFGMKGQRARLSFAFAGVGSTFHGDYGDEHRELVTSSLITSKPNDLVRDWSWSSPGFVDTFWLS